MPKPASVPTTEDHEPTYKADLPSLQERSPFAGKLSSEQMNSVWSPTIFLGLAASNEASRTSSLQGNLQRSVSAMSSPSLSEPSASANSSLHNTPFPSHMPSGCQTLSKYSPTASLEVDRPGPAILSSTDFHESPAASPQAFSGKGRPEKPPVPSGPRKTGLLKERLSSVFQWWSASLGGQTYQEPARPQSSHAVPASASWSREQELVQSEKVPGESRLASDVGERKSPSRRRRPPPLVFDSPPMESGDGDSVTSPILSIASSSGSESTRNTLSSSLPVSMETSHHHTSPSLSLLHNPPASFPLHKFANATVRLAQAKLHQMAVQESYGPDTKTSAGKDLLDGSSPPPQSWKPHHPPPISCSLSGDSMDTLEASVNNVGRSAGPVSISHTVFPAKRERFDSSLGSANLMFLSPVGILDQFIHSGALLHRGSIRDLPITVLEGVDWSHFGTCPHSEELGIMTAHVAMLHSQLLFERYQCRQHARRNRRLLSKARTAVKMESEIISLVSGVAI